MILSNNRLSLTFDDATGSLVSLRDAARNITHLNHPDHARLFRVFIPDEDKWISQYCDSHDSIPDEVSLTDARTAHIHYPALHTPEGTILDIEVTVTVRLAEDADEALFSIRVDNHTSLLLHSLRFPWIGGYETDVEADRDFARPGYLQKVALRGLKKREGYTLMKSNMRESYWVHIPMIDVTGPQGGIGCNHYCTRPQTMEVMLECQTQGWNNQLSAWAFEMKPFLAPGETYCSEDFGVFVHDGDPAQTWSRYKRFLDDWWQKPAIPPHLYQTAGYNNVQFRDFEGKHLRPLSDLPSLCRETQEMGLTDISIWDMMFNIYLRAGFGWFMDDGEPGRVEEMKKYVLQAREMGMHVSTLVNYRLVSQRPKLWEERCKPWAITGLYGNRVHETIPARSDSAKWLVPEYEENGHPLCQNNPDFRDWAVDFADEVIEKTGLDVMFLDQPFGYHHCFHPGHGHAPGVDDNLGANAWLPLARQKLLSQPDFSYLIGEVPDIFNTQYCDLWWHWPWNRLSPEVIRYVLPGSLQSWVIDALEHEHEVNRAFSLGMLLCINVRGLEGTVSEVPAFKQRIRRLADLKRKVQASIQFDTFIGKKGLCVTSELDIEANAYHSGDGYAIILGDCAFRSKGGEVTLTLDPAGLPIPVSDFAVYSEHGGETILTPAGRDGKLEIHLTLRPWECVVLVAQQA